MNVTKFGPITPVSLYHKKGARLATFLKQDIFEAKSLRYAMSLYDQIYRKIDDILYQSGDAAPKDTSSLSNLMAVRFEVEDFFNIMSGNDVFDRIWQLDQERESTRLFRNASRENARWLFPVMMRFFNMFHSKDFTDARMRVDDAMASDNYEHFIIDSLQNTSALKDGKDYGRMMDHLCKKYEGLLTSPGFVAHEKDRKTKSLPQTVFS